MIDADDYPFPWKAGPEGRTKLRRNLADLCWTFGFKRYTAVGRCEHGKPRTMNCSDCSHGFMNTTHTFFNPTIEPGAALVSDDGESVDYIAAIIRVNGKIDEVFWDPDREEFYVAGSEGHRRWLIERGLLEQRLFPAHRRAMVPTHK